MIPLGKGASMAVTAAAVVRIERAHQMYRDGQHEEALGLYTEALALARTKAQRIALHSNRAACYLKLHDFKKAAEECTSVLELDHQHTGALMLRAQTLVTLKEYQSALFDVNRLMELNPSSDVYQNLQARLKTQLSLAPIPESEEEALIPEEEDGGGEEEEEEEEEERAREKVEGIVVDVEIKKEEANVVDVDRKIEKPSIVPGPPATHTPSARSSTDVHSKGWEAIPKPKGHSGLDYSRWDKVEDDSSEDEDKEEEEEQPQYRFRVRTVGVRSVK